MDLKAAPNVAARPVARRRVLSSGPVKPLRARATEVHELIGADTVFKFPPGVPGPVSFTRAGGPILAAPEIKPIFWGAEWGRPNSPISPASVVNAITRIIKGPYLNALGQYGIGGTPRLLDSMFVLDSEPPSTPTLAQISSATSNLLNRLIDDDQLPEPDANWSQFNVVFLASTSAYPPLPTGGVATGAHSQFQWQDYDLFDLDDDPVRFAFIGTQALGSISAFDMTTSTFSHELVEAMTDPDVATGWRQSPDPGGSGGEIGDVCGQVGRLEGIAVQAYWSNADNQCVVPMRDHSIVMGAPDVQEGPNFNGPDLRVDVDQMCGRSSRWTGAYTYHIVNHPLTLQLTATSKGYLQPVGTWTVSGLNIQAGAPRIIRTNLTVLLPGAFGSIESPKLVTLTVTASGPRLQILNNPADGNFDVPVAYTVVEQGDDLVPNISASRWSTYLSIKGQTVWVPDDFREAQRNCIRAQTAAIRHDIEDLRALMNEFVQFVKNHGGPPVNQDLIHSLRLDFINSASELRLNAQLLADMSKGRSLPVATGGVCIRISRQTLSRELHSLRYRRLAALNCINLNAKRRLGYLALLRPSSPSRIAKP